jgi:protein-disulfide isomerase
MTLNHRFVAGFVALAAGILLAAWAAAPAPAPQRPAAPVQRTAPAQPTTRAAIEKIVREYIVAHPEIVIQALRAAQRKEEEQAIRARDAAIAQVGMRALLDPRVAYVVGPANAKVTVVEFFDYRCGYCKSSTPATKALLARGDVRFAFIEYPILTADSLMAAQAAVAARRQSGQKYVAFHYALMAANGALPRERILEIARGVGLDIARLQRDMQDPAVLASVKASQDVAQRLRLDGTPTFVINNKVLVGGLTAAELTALVKAAGS